MCQRTDKWYLARKGKITASEAYVLLNNHKEQMTDEELAEYKTANPKSKVTTKEVPFNDSTYTYLKRRVAENFMSDQTYLEDVHDKQPFNRAIDWGVLWESDARKMFEGAMDVKVTEVGFIPLQQASDIAGGSPDGVILGYPKKGIIEIKCPWNSEIHQDYCLFKTAGDLKDYNLQYYVQMQLNMLVTDAEFGYFVSFDPRLKINALKILRVPKDVAMCETLLERIYLAKEWVANRMEQIINS